MKDKNKTILSPTKTTDRIIDLDILRGVALFGILVVNIFYFCIPDTYHTFFFDQFNDVYNSSIIHVVNYFFTGKFYPIFSFLFGLGFFIQFSKAKQKGIEVQPFFIRRLAILLIIGFIHIIFVWEEDILLFYALLGFTLLPLINQPPKVIFFVAVLIFALPSLFEVFNKLFNQFPQRADFFPTLGGFVSFYRTASYVEILKARLFIYVTTHFTLDGFISYINRLSFFFFGIYAGKKELVENFTARKKLWTRLFLFSLAITIIGISSQILWLKAYEKTEGILPFSISKIIIDTSYLAQVFSYIVGFLLLMNTDELRKKTEILANPGRMALTNYLMQTTALSFLFYSYGLGFYAKLSPSQLMSIAILFFTFQIVFSTIWLKYFSHGPLEWIWRSLTYKKLLPLFR